MANTTKQNFRYPDERWRLCIEKTQRIGTDMTKVLVDACEAFLTETDEQSAERLGARLASDV